ncbi:hypothetical protein, partial [Streptomyces sp. NPDC002133]|uniref:hypothetical protein n=1 Tax=Streptomyces sp. NPDC002133 TaxID=3154409 RepID=UPI003323475A
PGACLFLSRRRFGGQQVVTALLLLGVPDAAAATAAGALVVALTFALLARPLRLTELDALLSGVRRRLTRR